MYPQLQRRFGPEDYQAGRHEIGGMIFVQADCRDDQALDEAAWVSELAASDARIRGIVAYAPVHLGAKASDAIAAVATVPGVVGVRRLLQDEPESLLRDPTLAEGIRLLVEHRLTFDLCIRHHQLRAARELVAACPEVTFVLDHLGKPRELDPWRKDIAQLAAAGDVYCKLSGLATEVASRDFSLYLAHALEVFGPRRCMTGSDWPVVTLATTVEAWFDVVVGAVAQVSAADREAVLQGTACAVYGRTQ